MGKLLKPAKGYVVQVGAGYGPKRLYAAMLGASRVCVRRTWSLDGQNTRDIRFATIGISGALPATDPAVAAAYQWAQTHCITLVRVRRDYSGELVVEAFTGPASVSPLELVFPHQPRRCTRKTTRRPRAR